MKTQRWRVLIIDDLAPSRAVVTEAVGAQGGVVVGNGSSVDDAVLLAVTRFRELEVVRKENEAIRRKLESRKLVDRAKGLLMTRLGMSEPAAFRRIQKTAMDTSVTMAEVAQALLHTDGVGPLRPAR
jgi:response regulator NasT